MRTTAHIALLGLALFSTVQPAAAQPGSVPRREVLTRGQIEASGIHRFSDLIAWIGTTTGTVEGLSWVFSLDELPTGLASFGSLPAPTILVDGLPIDLEAHQGQFPELLPFSLQQVDSVEVIREPTLGGGRIATRGVLHFHTSGPVPGPGLRVWGRHGAETGDPGPYQYTPERTPNVQRSGPDGVLSLSFARERWDLEVTTRYLETAADDSLIWAIHGQGPSYTAFARGGTIRAGVDVAGQRQQLLFARHNQLGDTWIPARGRVAHARLTSTHLGIAGGVPVGPAEFSYRVTSSSGESVFSIAGANEYARGSVDASADVSMPVRGSRMGIGLGLYSLTLDPVWTDEPEVRRSIPRALASVRTTGSRNDAGLAAEVAFVEGRISPRVLATLEATRHVGTVTAALSYSSHLSDELEGWEHALSFPDSARFDSRLYRASIGLTRAIESVGAMLEFDGAAGIWQGRPDEPRPDAGKDGRRFLSLAAGLRTSTAGPTQATVRYRGTLSRSTAEDPDAPATLAPSHQLSAQLSYRVVESFRVGLSALLKKAATWSPADYALAEAFEPGSINRVDLSAEKWFWGGRLRTQLAVANILGRSERYHPAGGDFALRYFVAAELVMR